MNSNNTIYYIGDIAKELGLSQRAIRYYEELGFITPCRTEGGFRTYSSHDAQVLRMVITFKELGMSLDEIRSIILPNSKSLTGDLVRHLRETLTIRRKDFETKISKYGEGVHQIDCILEMLSNCTTCGEPSKEGTCSNCLKLKGGETSPLMQHIFSDEKK